MQRYQVKVAQRFRSIDLLTRWALVCSVLAVALRLLLIAFNWPYTDSDEGNMGLLALHVAFQGDHPIFFYGGNYLGPLEGYAAVPLFRLFGSSLFALRLPLVLFFALFLLCMYILVRLLYQDRRFALLSVLLLGAGSPDVLFLQLRASGEYPEIEMCAACMCLLAVWLALTSRQYMQNPIRSQCWRRHVCYGLLGLVVGVALWVDLLVMPFVLAVGLLLAFFCWSELLRWSWCSLLAGCLVGAFPLIYYNLTVPWSQNSLLVFLHLRDSAAALMTTWHLTWVHQLSGTFFVALPMATGGAWNCSLSPLSFSASPLPVALPCLLLQGGWSAGYLCLLLLVTVPAVRVIWRLSRHQSAHLAVSDATTREEHDELVRFAGRLAIPGSAGLTLLLYTVSPVSASVPDTSFRYLTCLLLALPALLWPLWQGWQKRAHSARRYSQAALLVLVVATLTIGMGRTLLQMPAAQARYQVQQELVQDLQQVGVTRLYSDYWTCNILIFLSQERIICSALGDDMRPAQDRYLPYRLIVHATAHPGYIFVAYSPPDRIMQQRLSANPSHYHVYNLFEYHVYQET
jgi:4-amino-4-deoxy-L-arabinose transferase-like glycosyltransferase